MTADLNDFAVELRQLEALRDRLSRELDRHDAWRALCQLDERERSGHPVLVVESTAIRRSLEAQLRTAVPGWSLLVPLDGLIGALKDPDAYSAAQASTAAVSRLQPATPLVVSAESGARIEPADASPVRVKIKAGSLIVPNLNIASGPQIPIDQSASDAAVPEAAQGLRSPAIETVSTEALARIRGIRSFDVDAKLDAIDHQANRGPREPVVRETVPVAVASPPPEAERETVRPPESPPVASLAPAAPIPGEANSRNGEDRLAALEAEVDLLITAPRRADQASLSRISGWGDLPAAASAPERADLDDLDVEEAEVTIIPLDKPGPAARPALASVPPVAAQPPAARFARRERKREAAEIDDAWHDTAALDDIDEAAVEIIRFDTAETKDSGNAARTEAADQPGRKGLGPRLVKTFSDR